jgi:hypothetical protein
MLKEYSLNRILVLFTAVGFFFFLIDSLLEHWDILLQDLPAFIPVGFSALGACVAAMTAVRWNGQWIKWLQIVLCASFIVAGAGVYLHVGEDDEEEQATAEKRDHESKEKEKPLLAPLSFAGLATLGLLGTSRKWKAETV